MKTHSTDALNAAVDQFRSSSRFYSTRSRSVENLVADPLLVGNGAMTARVPADVIDLARAIELPPSLVRAGTSSKAGTIWPARAPAAAATTGLGSMFRDNFSCVVGAARAAEVRSVSCSS